MTGLGRYFAILTGLINVINICIPSAASIEYKDYWTKRNNLIRDEENYSFGGDVILKTNEIIANHTLMSAKFKEINEGFEDQSKFLPRANFLNVRKKIETSEVFKIIKIMPKGAVLHAHDLGTVSLKYILYNITYRSNLYLCDSENGLKLMFFKTPDNNCDWKLLSELRKNHSNEKKINRKIRHQMSMNTANPAKSYPDGDRAWDKFKSIFLFLFSFLTYKPIFEDYYYQWLQEIYSDKVIYMELRTVLPDLFELDGKVYRNLEVMQILKDVTDKFMKQHPDFVGVKIIYAPLRNVNNTQMENYIAKAKSLKKKFPSFVAGFDLVGQEDEGGLLKDFAEQLLSIEGKMPFFFHAGETNWDGLSTDQNLIDAVLLNAKRIGHGYALLKHPKVMEIVKEKNIAIEVNPISNQVLGLVGDLRNHPASVFFAENYPVVVSSDDPGLWGANALSFDFYEAFMGIMSRNSDLRALKKLAINSLFYSTMTNEEHSKALAIFEKQWVNFLEEMKVIYKDN